MRWARTNMAKAARIPHLMRDHRVKGATSISTASVLLIAAGTIESAERFAQRTSLTPIKVVSWRDLLRSPRQLLTLARKERLDCVIVHTGDWERQRMPQLYELALAVIPARRRLLADERSGALRELTRTELSTRVLKLPFEIVAGIGQGVAEALRFAAVASFRRQRSVCARRPPAATIRRPRQSVLAVWLGPEGQVGGAVTHISGILEGFRRQGLRVGLVTSAPPPAQLAAVIDDLELTPPLSPGARIEKVPEALALNGAVRDAVQALAVRLKPCFVYQRHRWFLVAGLESARRLGVPLVLEWNASVAWTFANWATRPPGARLADYLLRGMERWVARETDLIACVSARAAEMALSEGADPNSVLISPNAVNYEAVRAVVDAAPSPMDSEGVLLGWTGSFGPWHGAEVLIQAMEQLPSHVRAVLVGDGAKRSDCQRLAGQLHVAGRVEWTGTLPWEDALRRLSTCDVLVSPHVPLLGQPFFGSPTKIFEYMALGRPIVASRLEQLDEVLEDGRTAVLVEPGSPAALAAGIDTLLAGEDLGQSLGAAARAEAENLHTWHVRAAHILDRVSALTNGSGPPIPAERSG